jgi:hypothetical protein
MAEAQRLFLPRAVLGVLALLPAVVALASCGSAVAQDGRAAPPTTGDARADALLRALASGQDGAARAAIGRVSGSLSTKDEFIARVRHCQVETVASARASVPIHVVWRCRVPHLRSALYFNASIATRRPLAILDFAEGRAPRVAPPVPGN